ncbi:3D domain-containing protein [Thermotalea metallivorans]|uniref:Cell wall-binding protein YocH n=1 Tax=Thermotalea metallivorans TaxID=520762 RepID=A0A140L0S0_9FIRM|nr:3D domain-containing protein [Thermotalea metallivorans]KXG74145.1 Cell wall-binding protein YocH [Thermotalea metallivorans]
METNRKNIKILHKRNLIILGIVLAIGLFSISSALTKEIIIQDGDKRVTVKTAFASVDSVLKKGNIILEPHDQVSLPLKAKVKDGMVISIKRAHPVTIVADGKVTEVKTANEKVKDILAEHQITLGEKDRVQPGLDAKVEKYVTITIVRVNEKIVTEKVAIPYENIIKYNDNLDKSKVNLIQKGKNGEKEVKYRIVFEDGKQISKDVIEEKVITAAVDEIVEKGTAQYIATSRGSVRYRKMLVMSSTAYDAGFESTGKRPGDKYYGITRSGTKVRPGVVAVDPKVIPLGTKLYIKSLDGRPDYGFAVAEDTGGAIKGNKIDLYFEDPNVVKKYGRRKVQVYILD